MTNYRNPRLHYREISGQKSLFSRGRWGNWNTDKFYLLLILHRAQCRSPLVSRLLDLNFISMPPQLYPPLTNCQIKTPLSKKEAKFLKMYYGPRIQPQYYQSSGYSFRQHSSGLPTYHSLLAISRKEESEAVSGWASFIVPESQWQPWESLVLFWAFAISCPGPCCLHPEGCDMVENDQPASQHIPYLGNEHCVFAFAQTQEKSHRLFPNLKQVLLLSRGHTPPSLSWK